MLPDCFLHEMIQSYLGSRIAKVYFLLQLQQVPFLNGFVLALIRLEVLVKSTMPKLLDGFTCL